MVIFEMKKNIFRGKLSLMKIFERMENHAEEVRRGKMIALFIPPEIGSSLQDVFADVSGDVVQPEDMHITLGLMRGDNRETKIANAVLKDLSNSLEPLDLKIDGFDKFPPSESSDHKHVLFAKPSNSSLNDLHDTIFSAFKKHGLNIDNGDFDFKPHITLKYCDKEPEIDRKIQNPIFRIKQLSLADGDKKFHHKMRE